jgi:hypothetical protein
MTIGRLAIDDRRWEEIDDWRLTIGDRRLTIGRLAIDDRRWEEIDD